MKKTLWITAILVLALGVLGASVAFAQGQEPPRIPDAFGQGTYMGMGGRGMRGGQGGYGFMHEYMEQALADALGTTEEQVEGALANGTTMYQFVLDNGVAEDDLPTFMNEVHQVAFDKVVVDALNDN